MSITDLTATFSTAFTPSQAKLLAEAISESAENHAKAHDFSELRSIVRGITDIQNRTEYKVSGLSEAQKRIEANLVALSEAQKRTEITVTELSAAQTRTETRLGELATAQQRTEARMEELAAAQQRTETRMEGLAAAQQHTERALARLADSQVELRQTVGSLSETMGLSLENEAYRSLPAFLEREHNLTVTKRMIRHTVGGEEVDFLAEAKRGKTPVLIVGESKTTLAAKDVTQLMRKVETVKAHYKKRNGHEIVPLMIVLRAREKEIQGAKKKGVIVVQSFEL